MSERDQDALLDRLEAMKRRRLAARRLVVGCGLAVAAIAVVAALFLLSAG